LKVSCQDIRKKEKADDLKGKEQERNNAIFFREMMDANIFESLTSWALWRSLELLEVIFIHSSLKL